MKSHKGFTVIEILVVVVVLAFASVIFFTQKSSVAAAGRDDQRKTAINTMYHTLESVYYPANKSYPRTVTKDTLPTIDPEMFKDTDGVLIGDGKSQYRYEPTGCNDNNSCSGYTLRAILEKEDDFVKKNQN